MTTIFIGKIDAIISVAQHKEHILVFNNNTTSLNSEPWLIRVTPILR
jgi:hypothetical protein